MKGLNSVKHWGGAIMSAGLLWLSMPGGGGFWPLLFVALVPLLLAVRSGNRRQALFCGLLAGMFHFVALLYWLIIVLGHYGGLPWFFAVPAMFLLSFYLSLSFLVIAFIAFFFLRGPAPVAALWAIPSFWVALDWLRSFLFSGFPWMDLAYGLAGQPVFIQLADVGGHYGVTFAIVLLNTFLTLILMGAAKRKNFLSFSLPVIVFFLIVGSYSLVRWVSLEREIAAASVVEIGLVQGNIDQSLKWSPDLQEKTIKGYIELSLGLLRKHKPDLLIWPETALPFYLEGNPLSEYLRDFGRKEGAALLTGAPMFERNDPQSREITYFNSALLFVDGEIEGRYDKSHLVPFGEYVPLKNWLFFLEPLVEHVGEFSPGEIVTPLAYRKINLGVLICYESIFPEIARSWGLKGANLLVNITNDAWYGRSSAPHHSLAMTVFRAVENRRSLVRAANTGISAFVDPLGRISQQSSLFETWAESAEVPLLKIRSFYAGVGHFFPQFCLLLGSVLFLAIFKR